MDQNKEFPEKEIAMEDLKDVHGGMTVEDTYYLLGPAGQREIRNKLSVYKNDSFFRMSREAAIERIVGYFSYNDEICEAARVYAESIYDSL